MFLTTLNFAPYKLILYFVVTRTKLYTRIYCGTWYYEKKPRRCGIKFLISVQIAGVSILRAGETMEQALCEVCKDVTIGKILIQTNLESGEPEVNTGHTTK